MSGYKERVYGQYGDGTKEDERPFRSRSEGLEFHYTKKAMAEYIRPDSRVLEIGCATGYYAMHFADKCREYVGVDLFGPHIDIFRRKIAERGLANVSCQVGDALALPFADGSFDVVCCLGPMYHLPPEQRERAFAEAARVCKPGGTAAFAYINLIGVYVGVCVHDKHRERYPNAETHDFVFRYGTNDEKPFVFYFTTPEEMEAAAARSGLVKLRNMGTDSFITMCAVDQMDDQKFALYLELHDRMVAHESCTGMSNHALLICGKEG
ncbi:MAG: class I SAM-dependent methyltransferase [Oscillospiraceae bacterium]|nr:class I SAM-dependent methyltransferase [Oscillospiraceae bacterium]